MPIDAANGLAHGQTSTTLLKASYPVDPALLIALFVMLMEHFCAGKLESALPSKGFRSSVAYELGHTMNSLEKQRPTVPWL